MSNDGDPRRARSFGTNAEQYDRARPSYPAQLIRDLVGLQPRTVLDVGAGTGKATELLVSLGLDVLAVEADGRMAAIVARKDIAVEVSPFESWDARGRMFDLITAAQSWHWMPQPESARRAYDLLRPGGHLAAFWNLDVLEQRTRDALEPVYQRLAPDIAEQNVSGAPPMDQLTKANHAGALQAAGFEPIELRVYPWAARYSSGEWIDGLATHSDHATLPDGLRKELLQEVAAVIDYLGGYVTTDFTTLLLLAKHS